MDAAKPLARSLLVAALMCVAFASGCACARNVTWDGFETDEQTHPWLEQIEREREQDAENRKAIAEWRAKKEAEYRAKNPGVQPPAPR